MKIYLGADHAGFDLKEVLKDYLLGMENVSEIVDFSAASYDESDDYPDFIRPTADAVSKDAVENIESKGIIFGSSGQGEAIVANRVLGVRAAVYYGGPQEIVLLSREHNDANILSLGARFLTESEARSAAELWLNTIFSNDERHVRRIEKIDAV